MRKGVLIIPIYGIYIYVLHKTIRNQYINISCDIYIAACISLVKSKGPDTLAFSIAFSTAHDAAQLQTTVTNCDLTAMDSGDEELTQCTGAIEPRQLDKPLCGDETSNKDLEECLKMATRFGEG